MAQYIPKSKMKQLETSGGEFVLASNNTKTYIGEYVALSDGTFFTGNSSLKLGVRLIRKESKLNQDPVFGEDQDPLLYTELKRFIHDKLAKYGGIPIAKPSPTVVDYERGYFIRYFCKRVNDDTDYFEIDKKTHKDLNSRKATYDTNLYITGQVKWLLIENPNSSVYDTNNNNITLMLSRYPRLNLLFSDLTEHEPLHTQNYEELFYTYDNKVYTGYFHPHPQSGFYMEGAVHSTTKTHRMLTVGKITDKQSIAVSSPITNNTIYQTLTTSGGGGGGY